MNTRLHKSVSIDLFNLPPLPNECITEESYMDIPNNYYIPDGKNSRLLDRTDRVEFDRETLDGNTRFQLEIPYLEHTFGTKYFIMDHVTGSVMGIYDDKVEQIDLKSQLKPFNINQLNRVMHILGQRRLGLDTSSIPTNDIPEESLTSHSSNRMEYPSTPKQFNLFQEYKNVEHNGNMLTVDQRTKVYEDRFKVIAEMAESFYIFSRSIFFNLEMADQYTLSRDKYFHYFQQIVQNIDIFLQEDQLKCTKASFSLVPVPGYLPNSNDLEQRNADQISQTACHEVNTITREMQVIMQGDNKHPHANKTGSFSHLRSFELNDMGFSLSKISPITFDVDNPQTPANHGIKSRAVTSTPQEKRTPQPHSKTADLNEAHHKPSGDASYNPDESITNKNVQGRFVPPRTDNKATQQQSSSEEGSKECTILNGPAIDKEKSARALLQGPQVTSHKDQLLQHLQHGLEDHHRLPKSLNQVQASRIHWNAMTPMDPPKHPQTARAQVLPSQRRHRQVQMQPLSLLTLVHVLDVAKVTTKAKTVHIIIFFVIFVG